MSLDLAGLRRSAGAYRLSQTIHAFAALGLADALASGPKSAAAIASELGLNLPYLGRLLRALASEGVIAMTAEGAYELTDASRSLTTNGGLKEMVLGWSVFEPTYMAFARLGDALRTGRPPFELAHGTDFHRFLAGNPEASLAYDSAMESTVEDFDATVSLYDFSAFETVADVGGGSGAFLVTLLRAYPDVRGVCFDLPDVIENARMRGIPRDVASRLELRSGDFMRDPLPVADAYILITVLRMFEDDAAVDLLRAIARALPGHGVVIVEDFWLPEGLPESPLGLADLQALCAYGGRDRTQKEYEQLLSSAGLGLRNVTKLDGPYAIFDAVRGAR